MESPDRDRLDQWLDGALRQNQSAEPRPGLEARVLARIAIESNRHRTRKPWVWTFATASVAALFALIALSVGPDPGKAPGRVEPLVSRNSVKSPLALRSAPVSLGPVLRNGPHRKRTRVVARTIEEPKLEHFPSRRPLSEKEVVLESYAERFPAEAALIAREQQEFDQEIAKAQEEAENGSSGGNQ